MLLLPIQTPHLHPGDDLAKAILENSDIHDGDIVAVSAKVFATVEGNILNLSDVEVTDEGRMWSEKCGKTPAFRQAALDEARRMNGDVIGGCTKATLTEVRPDGLTAGSILIANAGLDESNCDDGFAVGWPKDAIESLSSLRQKLKDAGKDVAVLMTDSCCRPRRIGLSAFALTVSGFDPLTDHRGRHDLFGRPLKMTMEATADQLATAANMLMGNADQSIPAVIIREHGVPFTDFEGWVPGMEREEDLFFGTL